VSDPGWGDFEELGRAECLRLLERVASGHVAVTISALPAIFPVYFSVKDGQVRFITGDGSRAAAALSDVVALEADLQDPSVPGGWSVEVVGVARVVYDEVRMAEAVRQALRPWVPSATTRLIALHPGRVSGRRISSRSG
jgi:nitroimidazol reductase NimA-like FMN-containing flavoprotein (pyridoxamine 5'-phosphate oxidase superfamily)